MYHCGSWHCTHLTFTRYLLFFLNLQAEAGNFITRDSTSVPVSIALNVLPAVIDDLFKAKEKGKYPLQENI